MFYIVYNSVSPNTASGNRFLSFLKGFDELGVDCTAVLLYPSSGHYRLADTFDHVKIVYYWRDWLFARKIFDKIFRPIAKYLFLSRLKKDDVVFCYGYSKSIVDYLKVRGVKVYQERTEHPVLYPGNLNKYLKACKQLGGLFVISSSLKSYFIDQGIENQKVVVINMIVDGNRFSHLQKTPNSEKYIAYCGTASNNKDGVDELIKAFAIVCKKHDDVKLYIIGATPSANDEAGNMKLIDSLGIKDKVVFTGMVAAEQMPQLLKDATILALDRPDSIQAQNGFPTKLGEYLMTENPVVVTKVGDIPLFLKDGYSALLAEQRNAVEFASKLCWALEHPQDASVIGQRGKEVALREFNYLTESKKIIDFINDKHNNSR